MILQALNQYYDRLVESGDLERPGWQPVRVSYALQINDEGQLVHVLPLFGDSKGRELYVPQQIKRSGTRIQPYFLCDKPSYILGIGKDSPKHNSEYFCAGRDYHLRMLDGCVCDEARALIHFFEQWEPEMADKNEVLLPYMMDLVRASAITFAYGREFLVECPEIRALWDNAISNSDETGKMRCLVTGEYADIARIHGSITGLAGAPAMGVTCVTFNKPAYESHGGIKAQGLNAPISKKAAFAYVSAVNYMTHLERHHFYLNDITIVFWAENGANDYAEAYYNLWGTPLIAEDVFKMISDLAAGRKTEWNDSQLDPNERFHILGTTYNNSRLVVKFYLCNTFGSFMRNLLRHQENMNIIKHKNDPRKALSFQTILRSITPPNKKQKAQEGSNENNETNHDLMSKLRSELVERVLNGDSYPTTLYNMAEMRIRSDHIVSRERASIIKAFLIRNTNMPKEALTVELNENTNYQPYLLGRLFAVLEGLQQAANPGINTTIRDRFFNSACATPGIVFPQLIKLAQAHLKKLDGGLSVYYNRQLGDILSQFNTDYPARLSLYDQGIFQLGYYHQVQARYAKKEEK